MSEADHYRWQTFRPGADTGIKPGSELEGQVIRVLEAFKAATEEKWGSWEPAKPARSRPARVYSERPTTQRDKAMAYLLENPDASGVEVARAVGCSMDTVSTARRNMGRKSGSSGR